MKTAKKSKTAEKPTVATAAYTKAELTRRKILDATLESLTENGLEKTTLQTIGKSAGMGVSHIAYHFPDKMELIREAIRFDSVQYRESLKGFLDAAKTEEEKLRAFLMANFHWHRSRRHRLTWLLEFYLSSQDKRLAQVYVEERVEGRRLIQEFIGPELIRKGYSYAELEREAYALQMTATGFLIDYIVRTPLGTSAQSVDEAVESIVGRVFKKG